MNPPRACILLAFVLATAPTFGDSYSTNLILNANTRTAPTLTPTSTAFVKGDRIVIVIYKDDGNATTQASARNRTLDCEAASGVDGDTYLSCTETISFSADSNHAPLLSSTSQRLSPFFAGITRPRRGQDF